MKKKTDPPENAPQGQPQPVVAYSEIRTNASPSELRKQGSLAWLWHNVDYKFWTLWVGTLITAFSVGLGVGRTAWFRYLTGEEAAPSLSKSISENGDKKAYTSSTPTTAASEVAVGNGEFIRESSATELANYFAGIPPLQQKALFESSYLGHRVNWRGRVISVNDSESEYRVEVLDEPNWVATTLSFSKEWRLRIEQLRVNDRVRFEGEIKNSSYYKEYIIAVDKLTIEPPPSPTPTPSPTSKKPHR